MINAHFGIFLTKVLDLGLLKNIYTCALIFFIYIERKFLLLSILLFEYHKGFYCVRIDPLILMMAEMNCVCVCVCACRIDKIHGKFAGLLILK